MIEAWEKLCSRIASGFYCFEIKRKAGFLLHEFICKCWELTYINPPTCLCRGCRNKEQNLGKHKWYQELIQSKTLTLFIYTEHKGLASSFIFFSFYFVMNFWFLSWAKKILSWARNFMLGQTLFKNKLC